MRVLLVEDDPVVSGDIATFLRSARMVVEPADAGEEALDLARHYDYDAIVLDLTLPDVEGIEVVRRMRQARIDTPVIVLSGLSEAAIKVKALRAGADDVVAKPFDKAELLARVQAVIRRNKGFSQPTLQAGPLLLDLNSRRVFVGRQPVPVTIKEYAILELLVLRQGSVISKEGFLNHLYGGMDEPDAKIIDVFVCKLRKKLAAVGAGQVIGTVWGRGYIARGSADSGADHHAPHQADVRALLEAAA